MTSFLLPILVAFAAFSFGLGITLPLVSLDRLLFFTETPSLMSIVMGLWLEQQFVLTGIVVAFSILFPASKILLLHIAIYRGKKSRSLALLSLASKWSMMDVLLVALVIFSAKTSGLATATALPGIWFYAGATLTSVLAAVIVNKR
ncbi:paraquat-inducible protein A [uncultured Cohaesibacter sp.]|uniref:paraquat-inducible protein A n=1 Tax=uncultured Cohaesibacter sp. TaxID=1002546 RepID=UPI00292E7CAE|nr:paraquat-inducible protein A [uncultured Cohaesibacter sp.]